MISFLLLLEYHGVGRRKSGSVLVKQELGPGFSSSMVAYPSFLIVRLITVLPVAKRAIMLGVVKSLTIDRIMSLLI